MRERSTINVAGSRRMNKKFSPFPKSEMHTYTYIILLINIKEKNIRREAEKKKIIIQGTRAAPSVLG